jgi:hypothetical protein
MRGIAGWLTVGVVVAGMAQQPAAPPQSAPPPSDRGPVPALPPLSSNTIPPNLGAYTIDPLYRPGIALGWARERIRERPGRGLAAVALDDGRVHLSWRLVESDPAAIGFNVFRSLGDAPEQRINAALIEKTTDFVDAPPADASRVSWRVAAVVQGQDVRDARVPSGRARPFEASGR